MGRLGSALFAVLFVLIIIMVALAGCGSSATRSTGFPVPASIKLSPAATASVQIGSTLTFTGSPQTSTGAVINEPVSYQSSNPSVLTIATNGLACAGTWNSLTSPQICTPGPVGTAQVTSTSLGVSSPPTTVYVHQRIDSVVVSSLSSPPPSCVSQSLTSAYQASAFSGATDITATVGPFTWQSLNNSVVTLKTATASNPITGLVAGQTEATAQIPGVSSIFASVDSVNSVPVIFETCPVESITLSVNGSSINPVIVAKGGSRAIAATVVDTMGAIISGSSLTWSSSDPAIASVSASGVVTTSQAGGASIIASCTPPTCNIGILPSQPIYPENVVDLIVTPTATTQSSIAYVASTGCGVLEGCISATVPISTAASSASPGTTVGSAIGLPATPNSLVFDRQGRKAYLGTDHGELGTKGLMVLDTSASPARVSQFPSVVGKVLTVSPDGNTVIVSDTIATPNQVYVFNSSNNSSVALNIAGATAADFSPDSLKAYIVAGSNLYFYSRTDALQAISLSAPAKDVSFHPTGAFAYLAGGDTTPAAVTVRTTCNNAPALPDPAVATSAIPFFLKALPDPTQVLVVDPPFIEFIDVTTAPVGCPPTETSVLDAKGLLLGNINATQLIVSSDGSRAYVISDSVPSVIVVDIAGKSEPPAIALNGGATPIQASLTPDGTLLYVAANDGRVHLLNTVNSSDILQLSFPQGGTSPPPLCSGVTFTCFPDLIAVRP
jgi:hypothetical protein